MKLAVVVLVMTVVTIAVIFAWGNKKNIKITSSQNFANIKTEKPLDKYKSIMKGT